MLQTNYTSRFKKDLKQMEKRGLNMKKLRDVICLLRDEIPLEPKHKEHPLQGNYSGYLECHIEPDWLLIYRIDSREKIIVFVRTGSHSDLFK